MIRVTLVTVFLIASLSVSLTARSRVIIDENHRVTLQRNFLPTRPQQDIGRADPNLVMHRMILILTPSRPEQTSAESGADRKHYPVWQADHDWRRQGFGARIGGLDKQVLAVTSWLRSHGFTIEQVDVRHSSVSFSGRVAQLEQAFRVEIHNYLLDGKEYRANASYSSIPIALSRFVTGVSLDDHPMAAESDSTETVLYSFTGSLATPTLGGLMDTGGNFYGTTSGGGIAGLGSVFKVDPTGHETLLYSFNGYPSGDGENPNAGLVMDAAGNIYGTTRAGGNTNCSYSPSGCGIVFKLDPAGHETVLHSFTGDTNGDGANPNGGLILDGAGNLYGTTSSGGVSSSKVNFALGTLYKVANSGQYAILYSFCSGTSNCPDGAHPTGGLFLDTMGNLYGTTSTGGSNGGCPLGSCGTVFKLDSAGHETVLYNFTNVNGDAANPSTGLVMDSAGDLYGITTYGGSTGGGCVPNGCGTVYKVDQSGHETVLHSFTGANGDGASPDAGLIIDNAGNLYGTTPWGGPYTQQGGSGIVFKLDPTGNETVLYSSTGFLFPNSSLVLDGAGNLYGSTSGIDGAGGTLFKLDSSERESVIYSFAIGNGDGSGPTAGLIMDATGNFYGTTSAGGNGGCGSNLGGGGCGTVFKVDSSGQKTVLHAFTGGDGANPLSGLTMDSAGNLYGTTSGGGYQDTWGTVFKIDTAGSLTVLHEFNTTPGDGFAPAAALIMDSAGNLYGTTTAGGPTYPGFGTVFKLDSTGHETVLYSFTGANADGAVPYAGLIMDDAGNLYGTTLTGGTTPCPLQPWFPGIGFSLPSGCGTVFKLDRAGHETVLYRFSGASGDGAYPAGGLLLDSAGNLYGTTFEGGTLNGCPFGGCGTVFKLDPSGHETVLYLFAGMNGDGAANPTAEMINDSAGNLYGTTSDYYGGGGGTVFRVDPAGQYIVLDSPRTAHNYTGFATLLGPVVSDSKGNLYGASLYGGLAGVGTVFELAALPIAGLSTTTEIFGNQLTGTASSQQTVTITNTGSNATLTISSLTITGANASDFTETNNCGTTLSSGASCQVKVTFAPTGTGAASAAISITDNAPGSPQTASLSGTGTDFSVGAASSGSTSATVTAGRTATYNLQVSPVSGFSGSVTLTCSGAPAQSTCTASPSSVNVSGTSAVPFTATVSTAARSAAIPGLTGRVWRGGPPSHNVLSTLAVFSLFTCCMFWLARQPRLRWVPFSSVILLELVS